VLEIEEELPAHSVNERNGVLKNRDRCNIPVDIPSVFYWWRLGSENDHLAPTEFNLAAPLLSP